MLCCVAILSAPPPSRAASRRSSRRERTETAAALAATIGGGGGALERARARARARGEDRRGSGSRWPLLRPLTANCAPARAPRRRLITASGNVCFTYNYVHTSCTLHSVTLGNCSFCGHRPLPQVYTKIPIQPDESVAAARWRRVAADGCASVCAGCRSGACTRALFTSQPLASLGCTREPR